MHHYLKDLLVCWCTPRLVPCFGARDYCNNEHGYANISGMHCVRLGPSSRCITRSLRKPPIDFYRATPVLIPSTAPALHTLPYICCLFSWWQLLWLRWDTVFKIFISVYVRACVRVFPWAVVEGGPEEDFRSPGVVATTVSCYGCWNPNGVP